MKALCCFIALCFSSFCWAQFDRLKLLQSKGEIEFGALLWDLHEGRPIAASQPLRPLIPASTTKLVLGACALEKWGSQKRFTTTLYGRGAVQGDVLVGSLVFEGQGDPSLTNERLWFLTSDLARRGIRRVKGGLIVNNSYWSVPPDAIRGRQTSENAYDSPLSSAAVNYSSLALVVSPALRMGEFASIAIEPYALPHVRLEGHVRTVAARQTSFVQVARHSTPQGDTFQLSGQIPLGSLPQRIYRSVSHPERYAGEVLLAYLRKEGIEIDDKEVKVESTPHLPSDIPLVQVEGSSLGEMLGGFFQYSNNFMGDTLALDLYRETQGNPAPNLAMDFLTPCLQKITSLSPLRQLSLSSAEEELWGGSGLATQNKLTPQTLVALLERIYFDAKYFPVFMAALAVPGQQGTLFSRFRQRDISLWAKTGTLTQPVSVASLAGYVRLKNGHLGAFAIFTQGQPRSAVSVTQLRSTLDEDLNDLLTGGKDDIYE